MPGRSERLSAEQQGPAEGGYRPGYEIAAERILEYIVRARLEPGDRLPTEKDLAEAVGMSRTIVREAVKSGSVSYTAHFPIPQAEGAPHWTHVQARILRRPDARAQRIVGVVRDTTAEVTHSAFVQELEKRREVQTSIVERTTNALSRAVTVDDVTAALTGPGGLARLGAEGLALGLVENGSLNVIALSGESLDALNDFRSRRLDRGLPLAETVLTGRPRFVSSFQSLGRDFPELAPYLSRLKFRSACYLPLVAQARSLGGMALFYRGRSSFNPDERNLARAEPGHEALREPGPEIGRASCRERV